MKSLAETLSHIHGSIDRDCCRVSASVICHDVPGNEQQTKVTLTAEIFIQLVNRPLGQTELITYHQSFERAEILRVSSVKLLEKFVKNANEHFDSVEQNMGNVYRSMGSEPRKTATDTINPEASEAIAQQTKEYEEAGGVVEETIYDEKKVKAELKEKIAPQRDSIYRIKSGKKK